MSSSDTHVFKKRKTAEAPLYSNLDSSLLTFDEKTQPINELWFATVKYGGGHLKFQFAELSSEPLRVPFGIDDGSKYSSKPSIKFELPEAQRAFFQDTLEPAIKAAAIKNKASWFAAVKPLPDDATVSNSFTSRISQDEAGNYPPSLKVNVVLPTTPAGKKTPVGVALTRRIGDNKISNPTPGSAEDVVRGCSVVPVLQTAGGVWISVNAKKKTFEYGLVFEAVHLLVIEETETPSSFNLSGVEEVDEEKASDAASANGADQVAAPVTTGLPTDAFDF